MKNKNTYIVLAILVVVAVFYYKYEGYYCCCGKSIYSHEFDRTFSREKWLYKKLQYPEDGYVDVYNNEVAVYRSTMVCDLLENYIKKGMTKQSIRYLLGDDSLDRNTCGVGTPKVVWGNINGHKLDNWEVIDSILGMKPNTEKPNTLKYYAGISASGDCALIFIFDRNDVIIDYAWFEAM